MSRLKSVLGGGVSLCAAWSLQSGAPLGSSKTTNSVENSPHVAYCAVEEHDSLESRVSLVKKYQDWLQSRGIDTSHVVLRAEHDRGDSGWISATLSSAGKQTFASKWFGLSRIANVLKGNPVLISFPMEHALSQDSSAIPQDVQLQGDLKVIAHLLIEKLKGKSSYLSTWISILPERFSLPVCWTEDELRWLRGTSLHRGTMLKRRELERSWEEIKTICHSIATEQGLRSMPTFEDFIWAAAAFQCLCVPLPQGGQVEDGFSMQVLPGTEIFRPSLHGDCTWNINKDRDALCAVCSRRKIRAKQGDAPLTVSVDGDLSMEQLIFQHGVMEMDLQREVLMINCPIPPPDQWDATLKKRFALLLENGLGPQLFLSQRHYDSISLPRKYSSGSARQKVFENILPRDALKTLEIFVMDAEEFEDAAHENDSSNKVDGELKSSGMRMAVMTTIVRLLELKLHTLQDKDEGTGTLESDEALLEACREHREGTIDKHRMIALHHRMAQKALTKGYLKIYSDYLQEEMRNLHQLQNAV